MIEFIERIPAWAKVGLLTLAVLGIAGIVIARAGHQYFDPDLGRSNLLFAFDFYDTRHAALDVLAGRSPYSDYQLAGPFPPLDWAHSNYVYAPVIAMLAIPFALLPYWLGAPLWIAVQTTMLCIMAIVITRRAGHTSRLAAYATLAATLVAPGVLQIWYTGNVNGWLAVGVAAVLIAGPRVGALATILVGLTKGVVGMLIVPLLARQHLRRLLPGLAVAGALVVGSFVLAPQAWFDYPRVLIHLAAWTSSENAVSISNLSVFYMFDQLWPGHTAIVRPATLGLAALGIGAAGFVARRAGRWPFAVGLALASALVVPTAWYAPWLPVLWPLWLYAFLHHGAGERALLGAGMFASYLVLIPSLGISAGPAMTAGVLVNGAILILLRGLWLAGPGRPPGGSLDPDRAATTGSLP